MEQVILDNSIVKIIKTSEGVQVIKKQYMPIRTIIEETGEIQIIKPNK